MEDPEYCIYLNHQYGKQLFNFYRLKVRSEIFQQFSSFYSFNFGCIHFDSLIAENNGYPTRMLSAHFLFVDSNNLKVPYYMMGLNVADGCYVETLFANAEAERMFKGQSISYPITITISDEANLVQKDASYLEKITMLKNMKLIEKSTGAHVDAYYDQLLCYFQLASVEKNKILSKNINS